MALRLVKTLHRGQALMNLKVVTLLTLFALVGPACAFAAPLQPSIAPATPVVETPEAIDSDPAAKSTDQAAPVTVTVPLQASAPTVFEPIVLPLSIYILDAEDGELSSQRTAEQLIEIYEKVNEIWAQAGITIQVQTVTRVSVASPYLEATAGRDFSPFFGGVRDGEIDIPQPSLLNGFYARDIGGPNGIAPFGSRAFFVTDNPSVHSERVSSHEIGHILGLHHNLDFRNRLMFPGTNGMLLSEEEIIVARYAAQGLLDGVR
jgi:hypothetical protein